MSHCYMALGPWTEFSVGTGYWSCEKLEDTAGVRDLSLAGLFVATQEALVVGSDAQA
jgi:hypothetical protein